MTEKSIQAADRRKRIADDIYAQVRAIRPDLFARCVALGDAARDTIDQGFDSLHVAAHVEKMSVMLVAMALNLRPHEQREEV